VFGYAGKVVLITGTARGCGAVLAEAFARAGAIVVGCDVDAKAGEATAQRIRDDGVRMDFHQTDVSREQDVEALVAHTIEAHGRLSCAINNAGTEQLSEIADGTESAFDELIATDLKGLFFCLKHDEGAVLQGALGVLETPRRAEVQPVWAGEAFTATSAASASTRASVSGLATPPASSPRAEDHLAVEGLSCEDAAGGRRPPGNRSIGPGQDRAVAAAARC
jgi:NAD(P)-dependent dehydrogenase (short-subunit alcohol dehydrogenase family)